MMTPYFQMMSATRGKIEAQRQIRELLRAVRDEVASPAVNPLAAAVMEALYG